MIGFFSVLSTAGLYFMIIEVGFALCAVCLPSFAGALKLKAVQSLVNGISSVFSSLSNRSDVSLRSNHIPKPHRFGSASGSDHVQMVGEGVNESAHSFEMHPVEDTGSDGIYITRELDLRAEAVRGTGDMGFV